MGSFNILFGNISEDLFETIAMVVVINMHLLLLAHVLSLPKLSIRDTFEFGLLLTISVSALCWVVAIGASMEAGVFLVIDVKSVLIYLRGGILILVTCIAAQYMFFLAKWLVAKLKGQKKLPNIMVTTVIVLALSIAIISIVSWMGIQDWIESRTLVWEFSAVLVILLLIFMLNKYICAHRRLRDNWRQDNEQGNSARIIRCTGLLLAVAISITTADYLMVLLPDQILLSVLTLLVWSIFLMITIWVLYRYAHLLVLYGIDIDESNKHKDIAFIEAIIYIGIATIFRTILT